MTQDVQKEDAERAVEAEIRELRDRCAVLGERLAAIEALVWWLADSQSPD